MKKNCHAGATGRFSPISLLGALLTLCAGATAMAQSTWYVAPGGSDTGRDGHSWEQAFLTISNAYAKTSASTPETIWVSNGTYALTAQISVARPVTIAGLNGWTNTMVYGNASFGCFALSHTSAVLRGLTISNGLVTSTTAGGGVTLNNGSVLDCLITSNSASRGGGVYMTASPAFSLVSNCLIRANIAWTNVTSAYGGGVYMAGGRLANCVIESNTSYTLTSGGGGGGVYVLGGSGISDCTIARNTSYVAGGGLFANAAGLTLANCIIVGNYAGGTGTDSGGGGIYVNAPLTISGGTIASNTCAGLYGGGIRVRASVTITNASICYNQLTFTNSSPANGGGGGVDISPGVTDSVFADCAISYNTVGLLPPAPGMTPKGGGLCFRGTNLTVRNCRLIGNEVVNTNYAYAGGIWVDKTMGTNIVLIESCVIQSNRIVGRTAYGGGVMTYSNTVIRNCLLADNSASLNVPGVGSAHGGGLYVYSSNTACTIESCTIAGNYANNFGPGLYFPEDGQDEVWNCVVYSNYNLTVSTNWYFGNTARRANVHYTCTPQTMAGTGDLMSVPVFVNPLAGNYRLRSGSPGINAGTTRVWMTASSVDLDGSLRVDPGSGQVDMGCYEYVFPGGTLIMAR